MIKLIDWGAWRKWFRRDPTPQRFSGPGESTGMTDRNMFAAWRRVWRWIWTGEEQ